MLPMPLFCKYMIPRILFGLGIVTAIICTMGAINSLFRLTDGQESLSSSMRQKHIWLIGSVTVMILLCVGSFIGGWGPCGPGSDIARYCVFGVPGAWLISIISYGVVVLSDRQ